jgi:hypothetical protein
MKMDRLYSDQLYTWSDTYEESICHIITQKTKGSGPATTARGGHPSRISDRTLQEMWKTRLPVCQRARAWAQILSFNQPNRKKPSDGLCAPGLLRTSRSLPGELSIHQRNPERNLCYQFRTFPPQRETVRNKHVFRPCYRHRYRRGRHIGCQYDPRTIKRSIAGNFTHGGKL